MSESVALRGDLFRRLRIAVAFLFPAAVGGFVGALILAFTLFNDMVSDPRDPEEIVHVTHAGMIVLGTLLGATWGQFATLLIGLPAHIWLKRNTQQQAWMYVLAGVAAGAGFGIAFFWPVFFGITIYPKVSALLWVALASVVAGAVAGFTFWAIRRPDRDAPSRPAK